MLNRTRLVVASGAILAIAAATQIRLDVPVERLKPRYTNQASRFARVQGMDVHYRDEGEGPVLVLLHGTSASLHTWNGWTDELQDAYRVVRLDLPGFGLTGPRPDDDYRVATYVSFLHDFLDTLDIHTFSLAGNSLGGHIAWRYALAYPDAVDRLILIDPAGYPEGPPPSLAFRLAHVPLLSRLLTLTLPRSLVERSLREVYARDERLTPALIDRYYDLARRAGNRRAFVQRVTTREPSRFDDLRTLTQPTLLLWGAADTWIPPETAGRFAEHIPNATLVTYPDAGHVPMEELPHATAADTRRFLQQSPAR